MDCEAPSGSNLNGCWVGLSMWVPRKIRGWTKIFCFIFQIFHKLLSSALSPEQNEKGLPVPLFPRIKQPDARKRRSAKLGGFRKRKIQQSCIWSMHPPHWHFPESHLRFQELQISPSMWSWGTFHGACVLVYPFGGFPVQSNLNCPNYSLWKAAFPGKDCWRAICSRLKVSRCIISTWRIPS